MTLPVEHGAWHAALAAAQAGELAPADALRAARCEAGTATRETWLDDLFYGRCLAEAGQRIDESIGLLRGVLAKDPGNPLVPHMLALALARAGEPALRAEAAAIWRKLGLPHDLDLLGQAAFTFELQLRQLPTAADESAPATVVTDRDGKAFDLPWPESLARPHPLRRSAANQGEAAGADGAEPTQSCDNLSGKMDSARADRAHDKDEAATREHADDAEGAGGGFFARRELKHSLNLLESFYLSHENLKLLQLVVSLLERRFETEELHLVAGMAAEELGLPDRARAHVVRALQLEPSMLVSRTALGRIYWRIGETELGLAIWRSLPVEGPYDHGRHYHLALGHAALDDRRGAGEAMRTALVDFFYDTRHFYIKRAWERWERQFAGGTSAG